VFLMMAAVAVLQNSAPLPSFLPMKQGNK
jgi:hypothetical protein